ncbi:hypothetical protein GCM10028807_50140 [Spirosoma daeguense]
MDTNLPVLEIGKPDPRHPKRGNMTAFLLLVAHDNEQKGVTCDADAKDYNTMRDTLVTVFHSSPDLLDTVIDALIVYQFETDMARVNELALAKNN